MSIIVGDIQKPLLFGMDVDLVVDGVELHHDCMVEHRRAQKIASNNRLAYRRYNIVGKEAAARRRGPAGALHCEQNVLGGVVTEGRICLDGCDAL